MQLDIFMNKSITTMFSTARNFYAKQNKGKYFITNILPNNLIKYKTRSKYSKQRINVPPFLIASITSNCNLNCTGCYAINNSQDKKDSENLSATEWQNIFTEASNIGVSFILLAGGEPLLRKDIIEQASTFQDIIFPIFTNATMIDDSYLEIFEKNQNLVPIISIEGNSDETDNRRGKGIYQNIISKMDSLKDKNILYGVSITVTKDNYKLVTDTTFTTDLAKRGCSVIIYVEYVPVVEKTDNLVLSEENITNLKKNVKTLKENNSDMIFIHFPGDEEKMGGCLASGRGFFHINPHGGAEPCPFSPYAKQNLRNDSIIDILKSQYFKDLQEIAINADIHHGGCTLFNEEEKVKKLNK